MQRPNIFPARRLNARRRSRKRLSRPRTRQPCSANGCFSATSALCRPPPPLGSALHRLPPRSHQPRCRASRAAPSRPLPRTTINTVCPRCRPPPRLRYRPPTHIQWVSEYGFFKRGFSITLFYHIIGLLVICKGLIFVYKSNGIYFFLMGITYKFSLIFKKI